MRTAIKTLLVLAAAGSFASVAAAQSAVTWLATGEGDFYPRAGFEPRLRIADEQILDLFQQWLAIAIAITLPFLVASDSFAVEKSEANQTSESADEAAKEDDADKTLAGHSYHGEAFNKGPRQAAYLMEGTGNVSFPVKTENPLVQKYINRVAFLINGRLLEQCWIGTTTTGRIRRGIEIASIGPTNTTAKINPIFPILKSARWIKLTE